MKKTTLFLMLTQAVSFFLAVDALAGLPRAKEIAQKQAAQQKRIQQGIHKGSLTTVEAQVLKREQRKIRRIKKRFLADGFLNKAERRKLCALQNQAGAHIRRLKHNWAVRPPLGAKRHCRAVDPKRMAAGLLAG